MTSVLVTGLLMFVGLVGIVIPVLPGLLLVWLATALWAFEHPNRWAWLVFALSAGLYVAGEVTKYLLPGRRLKGGGVRISTLLIAVLFAVVGFFVIPVVGALIGFVLGVFLVELGRYHERSAAWRATKQALQAVAMSMGIELATGFAIVLVWLLGVWQLGIPS